MNTGLTPIVSVVIAFMAMLVAVWNVRNARASVRKSNTVPIVAELFREYRSEEFRAHATRVLTAPPRGDASGGFEALPDAYRQSAYHICYFFDYLGVLVAFDVVRRDIILGSISTQMVMTWRALDEFIEGERQYRHAALPDDVSHGFLNYFEGLVALIDELGGNQISEIINKRIGLRKLSQPAMSPRRQGWLS